MDKKRKIVLFIILLSGILIELFSIRIHHEIKYSFIQVSQIFIYFVDHFVLKVLIPYLFSLTLFYGYIKKENNKKKYIILVIITLLLANYYPLMFYIIPNLLNSKTVYDLYTFLSSLCFGWNQLESFSAALGVLAAYFTCKINNS